MTIKEAEIRTGLARANIRYYEEQGFFTPARGENGYRDYNEENIETLLKVKLLRQLGFSLEEISAIQRGDRPLEPALAEREAGLERESRELDQAARLCRDMRADGVDFYTLDARRYLDRLAREEAVLERDRDPVCIFPWRRFFARDLDLTIYTTLVTVILQLTARMNFVRTGSLLPSLLGLFLMTGGEILMLHFWGTTPGKALLGLKILREDGTPLSLGEAAQRTLLVMAFFGGGLLLAHIPVPLFAFISLGINFWAFWQVNHEKPLFWEGSDQIYLDGSTRETAFWDRRNGWLRIVGYLASWAVCIGLIAGGHWLASMPPHRGPALTAGEFVENYNRYMEFSHGRGNLTYRLTDDGTFEEIPQDSNTYVVHIFGESPVPQTSFRFTEEGGVLTEVTLVRSYDSGGPITKGQTYGVGIPYEEIAVAARCFLWKPLGNDGAAELYQELVERGGTLRWDRDGFIIDSQTRFSGYSFFGSDALFAEEGQSQSYFVECTMKRAE